MVSFLVGWALIAALLVGFIAGYAVNDWRHSKDQRSFSIRLPDRD